MKRRRFVDNLRYAAAIIFLLIAGGAFQQLDAGETPMEAGAEVYNMVCIMCHTDGSGSDMAPPLKGADVLKDPVETARIVLHGQMGKSAPTAIMPGNPWLTNAQAAAVVQYVRTKFGNAPSEVTPATAAKARKDPS